ncbi:hypothetical protein Elgi_66620 [Paenibacillus elgii]|nr:hypothetical protein Elgi_66620 [Paenibacillus elgii]
MLTIVGDTFAAAPTTESLVSRSVSTPPPVDAPGDGAAITETACGITSCPASRSNSMNKAAVTTAPPTAGSSHVGSLTPDRPDGKRQVSLRGAFVEKKSSSNKLTAAAPCSIHAPHPI